MKIINGDSLIELKKLEDNSIDSVVTDPPYGLSFMGKKWDYDVPSVELWQEVFRVLKPGGHLLSFAGTRTQHRMAVNIEDAGFEVRDMIAWVYGCLDETSEILTDEGFKKYNEIKKDDIVFSLNPNKKIVKNKVKHKFIYEVENETLSHIVNDNTDQLLTNNHKMLLREYIRKQENGIRNGNYETNYKYVDAVNRPMQYKLPLGAIYDGNYSIGKDFAELIGWVISEGHYQKDTNAVNLYQSSVNKEYVKRIKYLLGRLQIPYSEYQRKRNYKDRQYVEHQFYISGDYATKIKNIIPNKKLHYKLLDLPYGEKLRLIKGLVMGDGSLNGNIERSFYQNDLEQLQIFQILLHLSNKQGRINENKMVVEIHNNTETEIQGKHKKQFVNYTGKVWSIETEVGNYIAKRNGKIFITGNSGFPKSHDISKALDKHLGAEREIIGKRKGSGTTGINSAGNQQFVARNENDDGTLNITKPSTDLAKQYDGWGTALKPALEPITLARKPLSEKTIADNVLKWGVGGINIDESRVETQGEKLDVGGRGKHNRGEGYGFKPMGDFEIPEGQGRFPANLIHDGSEEVVSLFPKTNPSKSRVVSNKGSIWGSKNSDLDIRGHNDNGGSAARFFYCAKASKSERNAGLEGFEKKQMYKQDGSAQSLEIFGSTDGGRQPRKNYHPTVKPIKLMEYLVRLITPKGGVVLDPFMGSGSTGVACKKLRFDFIGIDLEKEYCDIAEARINNIKL